MNFTVPESRIEGFKLFAHNLDDPKRTQFVGDLLNYPSGTNPEYLEKELSNKFSLSQKDVHEILLSLISFISGKEYSNVSTNIFVDGIIESLKRSGVEKLNSIFRSNLLDILNSENKFYVSIKARNLLFENENILRSARILSDIRPIFTNDEQCKIVGSVIAHTFRIKYIEGTRTDKEIDFSIDEDDIKLLSKQLTRALTKEQRIREEFKPSAIVFKKAE